MRTYTIETDFIGENKILPMDGQVNAICFTNRGTNPVYINGEPLAQNQSISNNGQEGEMDKSTYNIRFDTSGAGTSLLYARKKLYK